MIKTALVIPTIRENSLKEFLDKWRRSDTHWDVIIVVEDNPQKTFVLDEFDEVDYHYSWEDIKEDLGEKSWIISKRDSAIRCYGFLKAYQLGAEYIFSLDDDCHPLKTQGYNLVKDHIENLENVQKWAFSVPNMRTRGIPYDELGDMSSVMFSMGLWQGIPDLDSIQSFTTNIKDFKPPSFTKLMPTGQYFPFCGMNFCFKKEAIPLCYFPLMGENQPYSRFDDIWFGIIAKKICDHIGWQISVGNPHILHNKKSDKFLNLEREATGIRANEHFWQKIDKIKLKESTPQACMEEMSLYLMTESDEYLKKLGEAISVWVSLFNQQDQ